MQATATPPAYIITDLGTLGGTLSVAYGINDSGQVTGNSNIIGDAATHAFLWKPTVPNGTSGAMIDLGTLGGTDSYGQGINDSGQVAGFSLTTGAAADNAFLWTPTMPNGTSGTMNGLGTLGRTHSNGFGINSSGHVAGQSQSTGDVVFAPYHAFLYDGTLNDWNARRKTNYGYGINDSWSVDRLFHGDSETPPDQHLPYDGRSHDLGTLGGTYSDRIWHQRQRPSDRPVLSRPADATILSRLSVRRCDERLGNAGRNVQHWVWHRRQRSRYRRLHCCRGRPSSMPFCTRGAVAWSI